MRRARAWHVQGNFLGYPAPLFGLDSTPQMVEWVGGWDGVIWDAFSSWTCPFPVGDMDRPLSLNRCCPVRPA